MDKHFEAICLAVAKVLATYIGYTIMKEVGGVEKIAEAKVMLNDAKSILQSFKTEERMYKSVS